MICTSVYIYIYRYIYIYIYIYNITLYSYDICLRQLMDSGGAAGSRKRSREAL